MDVRLPDGTIIRNVPDGISKAELSDRLSRNGYDVSALMSQSTPASQSVKQNTPATREDNLLGKVVGTVFETPLAIGTAAISPVLAAGTGAAMLGFNRLTGNKDELMDRQGNNFADLMGRFTYQPTTQTSRAQLGAIGDLAQASKLEGMMGLPLTKFNHLAASAPDVQNAMALPVRAAGAELVSRGAAIIPSPRANKNALAGVGAARTSDEAMRIANAQSLPVPIKLTRGQTSRGFDQQKFERETAKLPEGEPLRVRFADQNEQMLKNFDAFADETGAQSTTLRQAGEKVSQALSDQIRNAKAEIRGAYDEARNAGHMNEPIDIARLRDYLEANRPASLNATVLSAAESGLKKVDPDGSGMVSINDLEELRKMARRLSQPGTPNSVYGQEIVDLIDGVTRGRGGPLYQQARSLYQAYANDFRDKAAVSKLTRLKPGTTDRAVALEDVFDQSILRGSRDDVAAIKNALQQSGPSGEQAWRELQGQTIMQLKELITSNVARDVRGNPIVSPAELDKYVRNLDADGKLDFIFDKQTAQKIRDINDLAKDVYTSPPGSVNSSNTASVLLGLLDTAVSGISGMPLPISTTINYGRQKLKSRALQKKVQNALNP